MAAQRDHGQDVGIWIGGAVVIVGIATMIFGSLWIGLVATLAGLGGFARRQAVQRSYGGPARRISTGPSRAP